MWRWLHQWGSPEKFYHLSLRLLPWIIFLTVVLFIYGLIGGLFLAPPDYQQGEAFRIIYVHVPSAFLSLMVYVIMAIAAAAHMIWRFKLAALVVICSASIGAWFTFLALVTGALWGKPMWGTWWVWDARLTSELILLFLYLGIMALKSAIRDRNTASRAVNLLVLVGVVNIPIIHYSVYWWNTLHQGATLSRLAKPAIHSSMLYPLLAMITAFIFYYILILLLRMKSEIVIQERRSAWVQKL
ncbi:MAG: heme ABC transporter permease [Gammaproteobacteria bacterium]